MMEAAELHFGRVDILVNNAGVTHLPQALEDVSEADFDRIVAVNMKPSTWPCARSCRA